MFQLKIFKPVVVLGLMAVFASPGVYAGYDWEFKSGSSYCLSGCSGDTFEKVFKGQGSGASNVTVTAWSTGLGSLAFQEGRHKIYGGGLGVNNLAEPEVVDDAPEHAMDNKSVYDAILFDFGAGNSAKLDHLKIGWAKEGSHNNRADISVLAYTGGGSPNLLSETYDVNLLSSWDHVGDYNNVVKGDNRAINNAGGSGAVSSRYWLISAFNDNLGNPLSLKTTACWYDYAKIHSVSGTVTNTPSPPTGVPEPGSLLLLGLGLPLLRRQTRT